MERIKRYIQIENKKDFPYLSGVKICKASLQLGLITEEEFNSANVQAIVIEAWRKLFENTKYKPIDIHTPLWLWSRNGFREIE